MTRCFLPYPACLRVVSFLCSCCMIFFQVNSVHVTVFAGFWVRNLSGLPLTVGEPIPSGLSAVEMAEERMMDQWDKTRRQAIIYTRFRVLSSKPPKRKIKFQNICRLYNTRANRCKMYACCFFSNPQLQNARSAKLTIYILFMFVGVFIYTSTLVSAFQEDGCFGTKNASDR